MLNMCIHTIQYVFIDTKLMEKHIDDDVTKVNPLNPTKGGLRSAVSSPIVVWGEVPAEIEFGAFWWQQF